MSENVQAIDVPFQLQRLHLQYRAGEAGYRWQIIGEYATLRAQGIGRDILDAYDQVLLAMQSETLIMLDQAVVNLGLRPPGYRK